MPDEKSERGAADDRTQKSPRMKSPRRDNKIYRTPPTPPPPVLLGKEKTFVLDCTAVSSISSDYSKANPKLGPVIPPYNAQRDGHVKPYFQFYGVDKTLKKTGQVSFLNLIIIIMFHLIL